MKKLIRRVLLTILVMAALFIVLRAIVVPLARQRQERREKTPTILAQLPADSAEWVLRRNFHRRFPPSLWPDGHRLLEGRLKRWGAPVDEILNELELQRFWGAAWLAGRRSDDDYFLIGPLNRLKPGGSVSEILTAAPDTVLSRGDIFIRRSGVYFMVNSSEEPLPATSWLGELPPWREIGDLLMEGDWLEYQRSGDGGLLVGAAAMLGLINCQGLAWGGSDGPGDLAAMLPGPGEGDPGDISQLELIPTLRRSPPFDQTGLSMLPVTIGLVEQPHLQIGLRTWARAGFAAAQKVIRQR
jgi:hypothetical protein